MKHYHSDELRDYRFGLLDESQAAQITAHLETCTACSETLDQIDRQFAALDILKEQPEVSEHLVESILKESRQSILPRSGRKVIPFRTAAILAAAAGIAAVVGIFEFGMSPADEPERVAERGDMMEMRTPSASGEMMPQESSALPNRLADVSPADVLRTADAPTALSEPSLAELRAEKPFAPASNIELNVLPRRDSVQLTIYNAEDLTLVRETRKLTLKRGWNWLQFMWSNTLIDPTSLSLEPRTHADRIEINQLVYPPRLNELARWTIFSEFSGEAEFELTYFTSGLQWKAFYEATLTPDEQLMQLKSYVRVDNFSGEEYEEAQIRLVVGEINLEEKIAALSRQSAYGDPRPQPINLLGSSFSLGDDADKTIDYGEKQKQTEHEWNFRQKEILKQALSEYQLYTIEGNETIPAWWGKRLPSFDVQEIGVTNLYKYDEERWGENIMRFLSFANTEACKLGGNPLPNGYVRVFGSSGDGSSHSSQGAPEQHALPLRYIGASGIKYIPVGEEAELELGASQKVKVEPKLMRTRTENYEFYTTDNPADTPEERDDLFGEHWHKGDISGWDEITNWKIEISNTRDLPVEVEIMRATGSNDWEIQTDTPYEKYDANHLRFTVRLEPRSIKSIEYELTVHQGTRTARQHNPEAE